MARIAKTSLALEDPDYGDFRALRQLEEQMLEEAAAFYKSRRTGDLVGEIIQWPRADGYARYMVVSQRPLTLRHIATGDAWKVEPALIRGTTVEEVRRMVEGARRLAEIFGGNGHHPARNFS